MEPASNFKTALYSKDKNQASKITENYQKQGIDTIYGLRSTHSRSPSNSMNTHRQTATKYQAKESPKK